MRENINAGSSTLAAMSQNIANMGQFRAQNNEATINHINNFNKVLINWQKDFDDRKHKEWLKGIEQAKFDEQKRLNDANIDLSQQQIELKAQAMPSEIELRKAQAANAKADAWKQNSQTKRLNEDYKAIKDNDAVFKKQLAEQEKINTLLGESPAQSQEISQTTPLPMQGKVVSVVSSVFNRN